MKPFTRKEVVRLGKFIKRRGVTIGRSTIEGAGQHSVVSGGNKGLRSYPRSLGPMDLDSDEGVTCDAWRVWRWFCGQ